MINQVSLNGRLVKDPELFTTQNNMAICTFTLAVNRIGGKDKEQQADFIRVKVFKNQAENVMKYLRKGSLTGIEGRIQTSTFDDKNGNKQFLTEVVARMVHFMEPKASNNDSKKQNNNSYTNAYGNQSNGTAASNGTNNTPNYNTPQDTGDDDLPF